jgi:microcystin-dependent protein
MTSVLSRNAAFTAHTRPTTGDIKMSFVGHDHLGWLICDGKALSTTTYNLLFQVIGYTYGGTASTFNLPNMSGRVIGSQGTVTDDHTHTFASGLVTGEVDHRLTIGEMPAHNHNYQTSSIGVSSFNYGSTSINGEHTHSSNANGPTGYGLIYQNGEGTVINTDDSPTEPNVVESSIALQINPAGNHQHLIASNGGSLHHNNMQPTIFYGNTFIYCGIPTATNWTTAWPFPAPQTNPPLI